MRQAHLYIVLKWAADDNHRDGSAQPTTGYGAVVASRGKPWQAVASRGAARKRREHQVTGMKNSLARAGRPDRALDSYPKEIRASA